MKSGPFTWVPFPHIASFAAMLAGDDIVCELQ
jgi:hypothetical protein